MSNNPSDATVEAVARAIVKVSLGRVAGWRAFRAEARAAISAHLDALKAEGMVVVPANSVKRWLGVLPRSAAMEVLKN